jgi:hypothetical protein
MAPLLHVNGDSHSCGHDAGGIEFSYGKHLADKLGASFSCLAKAGCGNDRIIRTTKEYLKTNTPDYIVIGWSTYERWEKEFDGKTYNMSAGLRPEDLPVGLQQEFKEWIVAASDSDFQKANEIATHNKIWEFHNYLNERGIKHLFFNCYVYFHYIKWWNLPRYDWGNSFIDPYEQSSSYYFWLQNKGFKPSNPAYYHYGPDAHVAWADFLLPKLNGL